MNVKFDTQYFQQFQRMQLQFLVSLTKRDNISRLIILKILFNNKYELENFVYKSIINRKIKSYTSLHRQIYNYLINIGTVRKSKLYR